MRDVIAIMIMLLFAHVKLIPGKQIFVFLTGHRH